MIKQYARIGESIEMTTLENGLRVCYIPKPDFSKTFAMLATNFGSVDASFTMDGIRYDTPAGVAHFLEHKMFEDEDGNALQKFGVTGASPNAFTSHTMTAYHFSCTSDFEKNLEILLKFVFTPYFTDENVEKEKGIIGQEIGMMDDMPNWQAYVGMFEGLYTEHPVRISIAGSVESIAPITPEILLRCHEAFYSPSNMMLIVCGTADFERVVGMARSLTPKTSKEIAARHYGMRRSAVHQREVVRTMQISKPYFMMGVKDIPLMEGESSVKRSMTGELLARMICGQTSPLFTDLYARGLLNRRFETGYSLLPEGAYAMFVGESADPRAVRDEIERRMHEMCRDGVDEALFDRMRNAVYGTYVRCLDQPDEICRMQAEAGFHGENFGDFAEIFDTITVQDVQEMLTRWAQPDRTALSLILPREVKK